MDFPLPRMVRTLSISTFEQLGDGLLGKASMDQVFYQSSQRKSQQKLNII